MTSTTFGAYGGTFAPRDADPRARRAARRVQNAAHGRSFPRGARRRLSAYEGRPTPLSRPALPHRGRALLKPEDLAPHLRHKINNALGQALVAHRIGKKRIVAETGAGQHGVATATVAALRPRVRRLHGRRRHPPEAPTSSGWRLRWKPRSQRSEFGTRTLKEATSEAIRDWIANVETTYYLIGSCVGPRIPSSSASCSG